MIERPATRTVFAEGLGFTEGPVELPDGRVLFTSISGTLYSLAGSSVSPATTTGCGPTGLAVDDAGAVYVAACSGLHGSPSERPAGIHRFADDELSEVVTHDVGAPNDVCFGPDGLLYFTDPTDDPRALFEAPIPGRVCSYDLDTGRLRTLDEGGLFPNGLAFDASGEQLFVSESHVRRIVCYRFHRGTLNDKRVIVDDIEGTPDGMALDADGNIWQCVNPADAIEVFSPQGQPLERLTTGESSYPSNCCFAGPNMATLYVTLAGTGGLAAFDAGTPGLPLYPFR